MSGLAGPNKRDVRSEADKLVSNRNERDLGTAVDSMKAR
jgi:hypothetical protein